MEQFSIKSEGKNLDRSFTFNFSRKMKVCEVGAALERAADIIEDNWTNQTDTEQRKNECPGRHERMMRETGGWSDNLWWKLLRAKCWHLAYNKVIQTNCVSETKVFVFKKRPDFGSYFKSSWQSVIFQKYEEKIATQSPTRQSLQTLWSELQ